MNKKRYQPRDMTPVTIVFDTVAPGEHSPVAILEALRDQLESQHWISLPTKRAVLYGVKLCIKALKGEPVPHEITQ